LEEELLTSEQVMDVFKISRRTLQKWISEDRIPRPAVIGGLNRWKKSKVLEFISGMDGGAKD